MKREIQNWLTKKNLIVAIAGVVAFYMLFNLTLSLRLQQLEKDMRTVLSNQQATLVAIAEATARSGADAVTESIIKDCTIIERSEFDTLLGRLNAGLSQSELITLERLFGRCGTFFSARKAVMTSRLSREIEIYQIYVNQLSSIVNADKNDEFKVTNWQQLAIKEQKQSEQFGELVRLQDQIISTLLSGKNQSSPEITEILATVQTVQQELLSANKEASLIRSNLVSY